LFPCFLQLPFSCRNESAPLSRQGNTRKGTEAESPGILGQFVDAYHPPDVVKVFVTGLNDRSVKIDLSVTLFLPTPKFMIAEAEKAVTIKGGFGRYDSLSQTCRRNNYLESGARRILP